MSALRFTFLIICLISVALFSREASAKSPSQSAKIIIVLDDVGYRHTDRDALSLPVEVAFSILPKTPHGDLYAELAHKQGRDVMLHLPMAAAQNTKLGPSALTVGMFEGDIEHTLSEALLSVPYVVGVNNHMGSKLTTEPRAMSALMLALKKRSLFFLDSRTTPFSIAYETALSTGIPTDKRHIFLDHQQTPEFYQKQFDRLIRIAKKHGRAIGIAHPYPSSLEFLKKALKDIDKQGVELYPVSRYFSPAPKQKTLYRSDVQIAAPSD